MTDASITDRYQVKSDIEHILLKPGMYVGSAQLIDEDMHIMEGDLITKKSIKYIPALQRLYEEILLNAFDQTVRDGTDCTEIHVSIDAETSTITVHNNGQGLPILLKEEVNCYIPEMVFGMLRSGSNYSDDERITGGTNGLGAKLANIFSTMFKLETADADRKKLYVQEWSNHMSEKTAPKITSLGRKKPYTTVTFQPDLSYFKIDCISSDMIALMKKRLVDIGFASHSKIKTFYNGEPITIKRTEDYMKLYCTNEAQIDSFMVDTSCERWTVGVMLSGNGFNHASFVNGIHTSLGGSHVDHVMAIISKEVIDKLKTKKIDVKPSDVKNKLCLFLKSTIVNPIFDSQTKECLKMTKSKFGSEYIISDAFKRKLLSSNLLKLLMNVSESKMLQDLSKTSGTKTNRLVGIKGLEDANWAGTTKSVQTKLILTEGLSAKTFAMSAITVIGRDRFGIFPLKGKPLNVRGTDLKKVTANAEICNIVKILGLKYDTKYTDLSSLRYGGVIALADSDVDGSHICALILNIFHYFWPELLAMGYLGFCSTPIVKVYQSKNTLSFYTLNDYEAWLEQNSTKQFKAKYFKGLGTSTAAEARDALENIDQKIITFDADELVDRSVNLAFDKKQTAERKQWLMERYDSKANIDRSVQEVSVSNYINKELIHFSYYDNQRSIPNIMDGLKPSQRKILHTAMTHLSKSEMKVAQFGAKVAEKTDYHHGEASLMGAVVGMAQNYVGSNNINLLEPRGAFGSRLLGGTDAASPRYIFTQLSEVSKKIFDSRDSQLLKYLDSDGMTIEPEWFAPVIPMILVNGALGIGSGFSTNVLQYNPLDLCEYLNSLLADQKPVKNLKPWYRGFKGTVERLSSGKYQTIGCYTFDDGKRSLTITELPIGVWTDDYKEFIEEMLADKQDDTVSDIRYGNSDVIVNIEIIISPKAYGAVREMETEELLSKFKLSSKLSCTNMYLFNHQGIITKYNNVYEILKEFYSIRLNFYEKRRSHIIAVLKYELMILSNKVKFIQHVKAGKINLRTIADASLLSYLVDNEFDQNNGVYGQPLEDQRSAIPTLKEFAYLIDMPIRSITNENATKFQQQQVAKEKELKDTLLMTAKGMWQLDLQAVIEATQEQGAALVVANASTKVTKTSGKRVVKKKSK
jgi:DNA topoisomerase-2